MNRILITFSAAAAMLIVPGSAVLAAGPYDGTWELQAPPASGHSGDVVDNSCDGFRFQVTIKDNQITSSLARSYYGGGVSQSENQRNATPVTGSVQPDGTVSARWQGIPATGKLTGNKAELRWTGSCGPRVATGARVASEGAAGSSTRQ